MTKHYTGKGDDGTTGLLGEGRLPKYDLRIEAIGSVDEASAALGVARGLVASPENRTRILRVQRELYQLMAEVASTPETADRFHAIDAEKVEGIEADIAELGQRVTLPHEFIIPGDTPGSAALDLARTIVRRAERRIVELFTRETLNKPDLLRYINRLSSLLFLMEIVESAGSDRDHPTLAKEI